MQRNSTTYTIFAAITAIFFYDQMNMIGDLPQKLATHFGPGGTADGWMSLKSHLFLFNGLYLFIAVLFGVIAWSLPRLSDEMINMPNKEFYLSPERREKTIIYSRHFLLLTGNLTLAFLVVVNHLVMKANLQQPVQLGNSFWFWLALYLIAVTGLVMRMFIVFGSKRELPEYI